MRVVPNATDLGISLLSFDPNIPAQDAGGINTILQKAFFPEIGEKHPFWAFDWDQLAGPEVLFCSGVLTLSGILCSAGGIGGGGIYVSVLMLAGKVSLRNAVPLSKAIVFFGSMASMVLNQKRQAAASSSGAGPAGGYIDYDICRLVVPAALIGTLLGVLLNWSVADAAILVMLSTTLIGLTGAVVHTACRQYNEENNVSEASRAFLTDEDDGAPLPQHEVATCASKHSQDGQSVRSSTQEQTGPLRRDIILGFGMLFVVVGCGVLRHHAGACFMELQKGKRVGRLWHEACHHPAPSFFLGSRLETWMDTPGVSVRILLASLAIPILVCGSVMSYNSHACIVHRGWRKTEVAKYVTMGTLTGCLAGLVGIGGGLIFSPFFLIMGVDPMIAVATSSTCVIFTSSSTTLQYLLTDRIIISLSVIYGVVNVFASYGGTALVHFLQSRFASRRSYITAIVAIGVLISAVLSLNKLSQTLEAAYGDMRWSLTHSKGIRGLMALMH